MDASLSAHLETHLSASCTQGDCVCMVDRVTADCSSCVVSGLAADTDAGVSVGLHQGQGQSVVTCRFASRLASRAAGRGSRLAVGHSVGRCAGTQAYQLSGGPGGSLSCGVAHGVPCGESCVLVNLATGSSGGARADAPASGHSCWHWCRYSCRGVSRSASSSADSLECGQLCQVADGPVWLHVSLSACQFADSWVSPSPREQEGGHASRSPGWYVDATADLWGGSLPSQFRSPVLCMGVRGHAGRGAGPPGDPTGSSRAGTPAGRVVGCQVGTMPGGVGGGSAHRVTVRLAKSLNGPEGDGLPWAWVALPTG